jgi:hypothetical protein
MRRFPTVSWLLLLIVSACYLPKSTEQTTSALCPTPARGTNIGCLDPVPNTNPASFSITFALNGRHEPAVSKDTILTWNPPDSGSIAYYYNPQMTVSESQRNSVIYTNYNLSFAGVARTRGSSQKIYAKFRDANGGIIIDWTDLGQSAGNCYVYTTSPLQGTIANGVGLQILQKIAYVDLIFEPEIVGANCS